MNNNAIYLKVSKCPIFLCIQTLLHGQPASQRGIAQQSITQCSLRMENNGQSVRANDQLGRIERQFFFCVVCTALSVTLKQQQQFNLCAVEVESSLLSRLSTHITPYPLLFLTSHSSLLPGLSHDLCLQLGDEAGAFGGGARSLEGRGSRGAAVTGRMVGEYLV